MTVGHSTDRAQTTMDFAIGAGVFLITVAFVVAFVPTTPQPFDGRTQENTVAADRIASQLAGGLLGDPASPEQLDTQCTKSFFESGGSPSDCRYSGTTPEERVGLPDTTGLQVRLLGDVSDADSGQELLCWDATGETIVEADAAACDMELETGSPPTSGGSVVVADRFVSIDGVPAGLEVRTW
jgi:hypothetical protein